jgi:hypothetical protein
MNVVRSTVRTPDLEPTALSAFNKSRSIPNAPSADETNPIRTATTTEVMTCRPLAPSARNSASSRVRCATMIAKVLKMMKAPTNNDTNAKTRNAVRRNPSPVLIWS